jgi:protein-tyrosine-phosphatase
MKVLFIDADNVGRSQAAEALFNKYAKGSSAWSCAGKPEHTTERKISDMRDWAAVKEVNEIMERDYGIDLYTKTSKPFNRDMVAKSDKVIILCDPKDCPIIENAEYWDIPRLSPLDHEGKRKVIKGIDEKVRTLLKAIGNKE